MDIRNVRFGLTMFLTGAAVGGGVVLLCSPAMRKQAGDAVSRLAQNGMDCVKRTGKRLGRRVDEAFEAGKGFAVKLVV
jgi:hypothetical protein